jgi:hypothetical protein
VSDDRSFEHRIRWLRERADEARAAAAKAIAPKAKAEHLRAAEDFEKFARGLESISEKKPTSAAGKVRPKSF